MRPLFFAALAGLMGFALSFAPSTSAVDLFAQPEPHSVGDVPMGLAAGLLDGNALADVVVANRISNDVSIVFNPAGPNADEIRVAPGGTPRAVAIGDLDGDGVADVVVGREQSHPPLAKLINRGDGTFDPPVPVGSIDVFPDALWIGDLDADLDQDLVLASAPSDQVVVLLNDGTGSFAETSYEIDTAPSYPSDLAVGDADDDGDSDLLVTASLSQESPALLLNAGNGTFTRAPFTAASVVFVSAAIGDLAGDGTTELALLNFQSSSVAVFPNEGDGSFGSPVNFSIGASTQPGGRVRLADLDADGHPDAVVGLVLQNPAIPVLLGDGAGGFEAANSYPAGGGGISGIELADLDADGDLDIAATAANNDLLVVLRNQTASATSVAIGDTANDFVLAPPRPNPGRTPTIAFRLARSAHVQLAVFDVAGRLIARLVDAPRTAGEHSVLWLGTAGNGERVAAGVYTVRLDAPGFRDQQKIVLAR